MIIRECRIVIIDETNFFLYELGQMHPLDKQMPVGRALQRQTEPTIASIPARSHKLADGKAHLTRPASKGLLASLRDLAAYAEPISSEDFATACNARYSTISSRISQLGARGYVTWQPDERPRRYLVTPAGHQLLVDSQDERMDVVV